MAKMLNFVATREMMGDKEYAEGDPRQMLGVDASRLVQSGALKPADEEAAKAMAEILGNLPDTRQGIVHAPATKTDAPLNKDAGNAPANKGGGTVKTEGGNKKPVPVVQSAPAADGQGSGSADQQTGDGATGGADPAANPPAPPAPAASGKPRRAR